MAFPVIASPIYETTIPTTGKKIKYRQFLVKEEKTLLVAQQSEDMSVIINTIKSLIAACTNNSVDPDELSVLDIEWLLTQIRAKSVGEVVELVFYCDTCKDENAKVQIDVDLTKLEVFKYPEHTKNITLFNDIGVIMKYPTIDAIAKAESLEDDDVDAQYEAMLDCIDAVFNSETVYPTKEQSRADLEEFFGNLTSEQKGKIEQFFKTIPKLRQTISYECPVCGKAHEKVIEGLQSFFH